MISTSIFKLGSGNIQNTFSRTFRNQMYEAKQILTGITESHTTSGSGFVVGCRPGHIEGDHTLILVPDICHAVYMRIMALYRVAGKKLIPVSMQVIKGFCYLFFGRKTFDQGMSRSLVNDIRSFPFLILWIFAVAQQENQFSGFARLQGQIDLMTGNRIPSAGYRITAFSFCDCIWECITITKSKEFITAGVISINIRIYCEETVVVTAFTIFSFVINGASFNLHFTGT